MAGRSIKGAHTPENMTELMVKRLAHQLCNGEYVNFSNAYLATVEGCKGPIWCMDLYIEGRNRPQAYAILEEISSGNGEKRHLFICTVSKPELLVDETKVWYRKIQKKGKWVRQQSEIFFNCKEELCIRWKSVLAED